ncbi:transmembrane protein 39A-like [Tubulanus polymorphus]|uniref:transmembrane protein 39A-like n=1 Tax=Tubulanus polymorphus TaxID=672921 RepID=UPI003DA5A1DC
MPCTRRITARLQAASGTSTKPTKIEPACLSPGQGVDDKGMGFPFASVVIQPKHAHFPDIPIECNLYFESLLFLYGLIAMALQYVNLYRTVWWLPLSHASFGLNFYLIDPYLAVLLAVIMSHGFLVCFLTEIYAVKMPKTCLYYTVQVIKIGMTIGCIGLFLYSGYRVMMEHAFMNLLYLIYPIIIHIILFWQNLKNLLEKYTKQKPTTSSERSSSNKMKHTLTSRIPVHNCSMSPEMVRDEVEYLKTDFNDRVKHILFKSISCTYYMAFMPVCFAQNTLYYDPWWIFQHICIVWVSAFLLTFLQYLPPKYVDTLHQCALHLGRWQKVEGRHAHVPYNAWSELQVWQHGATVKHVRGLFKAEGINNTAEPGNGMHSRFYGMFHKPLFMTTCMLTLIWTLVVYQMVTLIQSTEWNHILCISFLLFCDFYMLFRLMRDWLILRRTYRDEHMHQS